MILLLLFRNLIWHYCFSCPFSSPFTTNLSTLISSSISLYLHLITPLTPITNWYQLDSCPQSQIVTPHFPSCTVLSSSIYLIIYLRSVTRISTPYREVSVSSTTIIRGVVAYSIVMAFLYM